MGLLNRYTESRPLDPYPHKQLARILLETDTPELAIPHLEHLDAHEQKTPVYAVELASQYRRLGDLERALEKAHDIPASGNRQVMEAALYLKTGQIDEGLDALEAVYANPPRLAGPLKTIEAIAIASAIAERMDAGRDAEAQRHFDQFRLLFGPDERPALIWALFYLALRDEEKALQLLREGLDRRERELVWLGQMSEFDPLRGRPEFQAIVEEIGVPNARTAVDR